MNGFSFEFNVDYAIMDNFKLGLGYNSVSSFETYKNSFLWNTTIHNFDIVTTNQQVPMSEYKYPNLYLAYEFKLWKLSLESRLHFGVNVDRLTIDGVPIFKEPGTNYYIRLEVSGDGDFVSRPSVVPSLAVWYPIYKVNRQQFDVVFTSNYATSKSTGTFDVHQQDINGITFFEETSFTREVALFSFNFGICAHF